MGNNETYNKILIVIFMMCIIFVCIVSVIKEDVVFSENENKVMAIFPNFKLESLLNGEYTSKVEEYFSDHIIFRNEIISFKTITNIVMNKKDNSRVYFAKNNMLMEMHENIVNESVDTNINVINKFNEFLNDKYSVNMDLMLVNTKTSIYEDMLPKFANVNNEDEIIDYIYSTSNTNNIDISDILKANKDKYIYFNLDHHWTQLGAYLAYCKYSDNKGYDSSNYTITTNLTNEFFGSLYSKAINPNLKPDSIIAYNLDSNLKYNIRYDGSKVTNNVYQKSNLNKKDKYTVFLDGNHSVVEINTNNKNGKTMVIFKDSFGHPFIPFLLNEYEKVIVLDLRYVYTDLNVYFKNNNVTDVLMLYNIYNFVNKNEFIKLDITS